jgi:hypothetical protein
LRKVSEDEIVEDLFIGFPRTTAIDWPPPGVSLREGRWRWR